MSCKKTVAELFIPLLIVLMAADNKAAISKPKKPVGICVLIKNGNTLSP